MGPGDIKQKIDERGARSNLGAPRRLFPPFGEGLGTAGRGAPRQTLPPAFGPPVRGAGGRDPAPGRPGRPADSRRVSRPGPSRSQGSEAPRPPLCSQLRPLPPPARSPPPRWSQRGATGRRRRAARECPLSSARGAAPPGRARRLLAPTPPRRVLKGAARAAAFVRAARKVMPWGAGAAALLARRAPCHPSTLGAKFLRDPLCPPILFVPFPEKARLGQDALSAGVQESRAWLSASGVKGASQGE